MFSEDYAEGLKKLKRSYSRTNIDESTGIESNDNGDKIDKQSKDLTNKNDKFVDTSLDDIPVYPKNSVLGRNEGNKFNQLNQNLYTLLLLIFWFDIIFN